MIVRVGGGRRRAQTDENESERLLSTGRALMVLEIPKDFTRNLAKGKPAPVQVLIDGTNSNSAAMALASRSKRSLNCSAETLTWLWRA